MKTSIAFFLGFFLIPGMVQANEYPPRAAVRANTKGLMALLKEKNYEAYKSFVQGLAVAPYQPELHLNLGFTFHLNKEYEKAAQAYLTAGELSKVPEMQFNAYFNAGNAWGDAKKVNEALAAYQKALQIKPDSIETKTNIELLLSKNGGGGQGEDSQDQSGQDQDQEKQKEGDGDQDQKNQQPQNNQEKNKKPQKFESDSLTQDDVRKILEELKEQEQKIRAKQQDGKAKESDHGKNW